MFGASADNLRELLGKQSPFGTVTLQQLLCWTLWEFNVKTQKFYFPLIVRFLIIIVIIIIIIFTIVIVIGVKNVTQNFILLYCLVKVPTIPKVGSLLNT